MDKQKIELIAPTSIGGQRALYVGVQCGRGPEGVGEGANGCALSVGTTPRVRAVPGTELRDLEKESTQRALLTRQLAQGAKRKKKMCACN